MPCGHTAGDQIQSRSLCWSALSPQHRATGWCLSSCASFSPTRTTIIYHNVLGRPENQCGCHVTLASATTFPVFTGTRGESMAWHPHGDEVWEQEPLPVAVEGTAVCWPQHLQFCCLAKPAGKTGENCYQTTARVTPFYRWENQGVARLKHSQDSNPDLLIPTQVLFPLRYSDWSWYSKIIL